MVAMAFTTSAQSYDSKVVTLTTNYIAASAASNFNAVIDAPRASYVGLAITLQANGATTTDATAHIQRSVDRVNWETAGTGIALKMNGTTATTTISKVDLNGAAYLRLNYITNAHASVIITNITVRAGVKSGL